MKYWSEIIFILSFFLASVLLVYGVNTYAGYLDPNPCDQQVYDALYFRMTADALSKLGSKTETERQIAMDRYAGVINLRRLCHGQLSTYEKGWKL